MPIDKDSDLVLLNSLSESSIVTALSSRFSSDKIYTYIGSGQVLLAVNPFKQISGLYAPATLSKYRNKRPMENPPHVYAIAEKALKDLKETHRPQCVLVSGESGAGKTENAKKLMEYITSCSAASSSSSSSKPPSSSSTTSTSTTSSIKDKILRSNVLLEAFGNAKTLRNDNSSRFGKLMEILFDYGGGIVGGRVTSYLLEKVRITTPKQGERNFHIFYQLCAACERGGEYSEELGLASAQSYSYLSRTGCFKVPKIDDVGEFEATDAACDAVGFKREDKVSLFKLCAAILNLGNVEFKNAGNEGSCIAPESEGAFAWVAFHLCVDDASLRHELTHRRIEVNGEVFDKPLLPEDAVRSRDSLAMSLYANAFTDIVKKLNDSMECSGQESSRIGILDIYGFEIFDENSMEQLHINYCNEKLQQLFIELTLRAEQEEYAKEGIAWETVKYFDNAPVVSLIESKRPPGVLALLDEESVMPKATDESFGQKLSKHIQNAHFVPMGNTHFQIKHYAGDVVYANAGMLEKNKDQLNKNLVDMLFKCQSPYVNSLYPAAEKTLKKPPTVSTQFKEQMTKLMDNLHQCNAHYVRTIKPNDQKKAGVFTSDMVLNQVTYLGLKENVIVRRAGYAVRQPYEEFFARYRLICDEVWPFGTGNARDDCVTILNSMGITSGYEMGKTRIFIREAATLFDLEDAYDEKLNMVANKIQGAYRKWIAIKYFLELKKKAESIFGGKKRRSGSVHLQFYGDYLSCGESLALSLAMPDERSCDIKFADIIDKVNRKGVVQQRLLIITGQAFYFCTPPIEKTTLKSKNMLNCLLGLSLSTMADSYLILHFTDHDYVIVSRRKTEIVCILKERYQTLMNTELPVDFNDNIQYKTWGGGIFRSKTVVMNNVNFTEDTSLPNNTVALKMQSGTMFISVPANLCSRSLIGLTGYESPAVASAAAGFASGSSYGKSGGAAAASGGAKPPRFGGAAAGGSQTNIYKPPSATSASGGVGGAAGGPPKFSPPPKNPYSAPAAAPAPSMPQSSSLPRANSPPPFRPPGGPGGGGGGGASTPPPFRSGGATSPQPVSSSSSPPSRGVASLAVSSPPPPLASGAARGPPAFGGLRPAAVGAGAMAAQAPSEDDEVTTTRPKSLSRATPIPPPKKAQPPPPPKKNKMAVALYDYEASDATELSFVEGQELEIVKENDDGWWRAKISGREGTIPGNYVKLL